MENQNNEQQVQYAPKTKTQHRIDQLTNIAAVTSVAVLGATAAKAADGDVDIGTLAIGGLGAAAAGVFAIKATPSLMMWGYRKILGFIGR
ncbi:MULTISPECIES: hypothetical protein [Acinetobacter]|uniref:Uncharacterized protein n=1 Tax=Acinetobacter baylyi (strain ATCC 33305 / BD413 / ADP1) TaxID=62977 RepID=Q6FB75_ACIAD|nr:MULTISPECIES: hypothetical protein [Acinetobacter]ENV54373.1 hypothetical protein F952_01679 [Acinetobacter baylyi DSM 14961 = CIP 107474]KAF2369376.1 hypothetical protein BSL88_16035 [Acinetobacter baylyi]KAF2370880.1 hypothetical protein BSL67_16555 [Acinetobacter baylyi]KAF2374953.1 hypothetical protein BSN81_16615 [Acinetobacter baylyi]KAF2379203.1 hypothetical protein BSN83_16470 [Acinetobacter baylyi]